MMVTLDRYHLPYDWISENDETKRTFKREENRIKISTIDSSKGLDFQAVFIVYVDSMRDRCIRNFCGRYVFIVNVDSMPFPLEEDKEREVPLLYIT